MSPRFILTVAAENSTESLYSSYFAKFFDSFDMSSSLNDYQLGGVLHRGTFSTIRLVKELASGRIFALKSVEVHVTRKTQYLLEAETEIRSQNASQWIVGLQNYFQDAKKTHFVMEYLPGGTFANLLQSNNGRLEESAAMFYLGELVLAINSVHCLGFAHRNIKPEHILLDGLGHIKISGFGSASKISQDEDGKGIVTSPLIVDSASYEAPEILRTLGNKVFTYGVECDYWSLGVIAYQVLVGGHPFQSSSPLSAFKKITAKKSKGAIKIPTTAKKVSQEGQDFICGLLLEQEERYKYPDCISHPFFNDLIWDGLRSEVAPLKVAKDIHKKELEELGGIVGDENNFHNFTNFICEDIGDENDANVKDAVGEITEQKITDVTFVFPTSTQTTLGAFGGQSLLGKKKSMGGGPQSLLETPLAKVDEEEEKDYSSWSVTDAVEQSGKKAMNKSRSILFPPLKTEEEKLQSELSIKTEQLMDRLHEIQILQTQLQKSSEDLEAKEKLLTSSAKANQRLKTEMEHLSALYSNEKNAREGLEHKLDKLNTSVLNMSKIPHPQQTNTMMEKLLGDESSDEEAANEIFELKERLAQLSESDSQKDDMIQDLTVRVKILQHELRVQQLENQIMFRRDEGNINIFQEAYKQTIDELRQRLKELEKIAGEKREGGEFEEESKIRKLLEGKNDELTEIGMKIGEIRSLHEKNLGDAVQNRKEIAQALGTLQVKMDQVFQEYI